MLMRSQLEQHFPGSPGSLSSPGSPGFHRAPSSTGSPGSRGPPGSPSPPRFPRSPRSAGSPAPPRLSWLPRSQLPRLPRLSLTWRYRRGERRSCERGREQALPDEESTGVMGRERGGARAPLLRSHLQLPPPVMPALDPSGNTSSHPPNNASARLSRNYCLSPPVAPAITLSGPTYRRPLR